MGTHILCEHGLHIFRDIGVVKVIPGDAWNEWSSARAEGDWDRMS